MALETLDFRRLEGAVIASLGGEIDISNARSVRERLLDAVPNTATSLVLDLSDAGYLDSSGVRVIFELAGRLRSRGQKLELVVPDDSVIRRVLLLTEVQRVVPMSVSVDAALGS
jgi:anti-sigma B factor antagonist/stage II sporulation protein AA (anti-sigma F factor antagonist)